MKDPLVMQINQYLTLNDTKIVMVGRYESSTLKSTDDVSTILLQLATNVAGMN